MAGSNTPIARIRPLFTGSLTCGDANFLMAGLTGAITLPIPSYLIEHQSGSLALFDTGLHPDLRSGPEALGKNRNLFAVERFGDDDTVGARVAAAGADPGAVERVIFSHLHFDHCGGTKELPNARLLCQESEWKAGHHPKLVDADVYTPAFFDIGHDVELLDGRLDVFGDGSVVVIPTPGHTIGHQSLQVQTADGPVVLCADACYFRQALETLTLPGFGYDLDQQRASMQVLGQLGRAGATLWFGHDAEQFAALPEVV